MKRSRSDDSSAARTPRFSLLRSLSLFRATQRASCSVQVADRVALARAIRTEIREAPNPDGAAIRGALNALCDAREDVIIDVDADLDCTEAEVDAIVEEAKAWDTRDVLNGSASAPNVNGDQKQDFLPTFFLNRTKGVPEGRSYSLLDVVVTHPRPKLCVIMNFLLDIGFLAKEAPGLFKAERIILVHGLQPGQLELSHLREVFDAETRRRITLVRPETPSYGTVHSKAVLTFCGDAGCRVLVHTANDIEEDWKCRTQGAWWRDFPKKKPGSQPSSSEFEEALADYFQAASKGGRSARDAAGDEQGRAVGANGSARILSTVVIPTIREYCFDHAGCHLVTSVPGHHGKFSPADREKYGLGRLRAMLSRESFAGFGTRGTSTCRDDAAEEDETRAVVVQFSSLGSISTKWFDEELVPTLFASARSREEHGGRENGDNVQLMLPTLIEIAASNESFAAGGSLPVRGANVHREHIRKRLHGWCADGSSRSKAMPHIKTIVRYRRNNPAFIDYVYVGSANLSGAAWGWTRRKGKKDEHLHTLSFEMGVLFTPEIYCPPSFSLDSARVPRTVPRESLGPDKSFQFRRCEPEDFREEKPLRGGSAAPSLDTSALDVRFPIPYDLPPVPYDAGDVPWHVDCAQSPNCTPQCRLLLRTLTG